MNLINSKNKILLTFLSVYFMLVLPLGAQTRISPIDVNIIIDSSKSLSEVKSDVIAWISSNIDQTFAAGDKITVWKAETAADPIYSAKFSGPGEKNIIIKSIQDIVPSGDKADFTSALQKSSAVQAGFQFKYTLLICTSPDSLSSILLGPRAKLLQYSRVEEFSSWRVLVVGLGLDEKIRKAADVFMNP
ncbi:MAG: hypothetical protein LBB81_04600 [Treponema sp.]|jgi:hypothetical protein|nr:hypothetical protein [Treponema sp.]